MPCACRVPVPDYPSNAAWGPILWKILHCMAEKAQGASIPADEIREWQKFIRLTGEMLPCDECREHFLLYTKEHPLTHFAEIPYNVLRTAIKTWFWQLHADIRTDYGLSVLPYDQLTATYGSENLQDLFWRLEPVIQQTINIKGMGLMKWIHWNKSFKMLRANLGV